MLLKQMTGLFLDGRQTARNPGVGLFRGGFRDYFRVARYSLLIPSLIE